jgi:hypothetical protein
VVDLATTDHCHLSLLMFLTAAACHHHPTAVVIPVLAILQIRPFCGTTFVSTTVIVLVAVKYYLGP